MASGGTATRWEAPQFSFNTPDQTQEWKNFYTRVLDFLEMLDIDPERQDENKCGWKQIKMIFQGEDRQTLQTTIDNKTITTEDQQTPTKALKAIQSCIKDEEHFWYFRDEVMSDVQQQPNEQIHALNRRITTLVNNCRFQDQNTTNTIKLMLLQHAVRFYEARDWICLQDQSQLTYASLLQHCKTLEQRCEQYQKAQIKGRAELTNLSAATATASSVHQDNVTIHNTQCTRCGYKHPRDNCPAKGKECYNCHGLNHYTALCRRPKQRKNSPCRTTSRPRYRKYSKSRQGSRSPSKHRQSCHRSPSPTNTRRSSHQPRRQRSPTRSQQVSHITSSTETSAEGKLHTDIASDGHTSFHTTLQMVTKQGSKPLPVKVDPGTDVNTIPLTKYRKLFPTHFTKAGNLKQKVLHSTRHTWTAHNETPQQFLGYFIADIHHKTMPEVLPITFYVFNDTTSLKILLSYAASEKLGIVKFQIPNEAPSIALDTISKKLYQSHKTNSKVNTTEINMSHKTIITAIELLPRKTISEDTETNSQKSSLQDHHNHQIQWINCYST